MALKKYLVRDGFVVLLRMARPDGSVSEREYRGGEECTLDDDQAELHRHKLELADKRDREAALAAEKAARVAQAASGSPAELVQALVAALQQAQAAAAPASPAA